MANISVLDQQGQRLLRLLVSRLPKVKANDPRTFITYRQVHEALGLSQQGQTLGRSLQHQGLNSLAHWTVESGLPGITGLIVDRESQLPGPGYFTVHNRGGEEYGWWLAEIEKAKHFDWTPYVANPEDEKDTSVGDDWTIDELRASVAAYLEMQQCVREGIEFTKTSFYAALSERFGRSAKAFEYRMRNISYVLSLLGRDWLDGLYPATNVGGNIAAQIEALIAEAEEKPLRPVVEFEITVRESLKKKSLPQPKGNASPTTSTSTITQYQRDPLVKAWVLKEANGTCERCAQPAPFKTVEGDPFLEVHHVRKLADKGSDSVTNAVAICPNCHRELHYGQDAKRLIDELYQNVTRLIRE
ncbi:HNH endonuclease [Pseudomonas sp. ZM23]|uniref:HNH endonuclease n=1 Tax=Pseudomonas triclosanedens TaxID=2961893 RepID=A0ABY7A4R5_9PSED|nr:HNH endonuclease [Pseudomonas triclosanedens]MCP8465506.1 HNH endonuclease [Pseudomonas triclosanedens]MCP8471001.1 HNH endonuclease [Pseudomonas triclosanedens]MCP8476805.1 HNH endonuclease [Pseudomonas triclosanedens]WAI52078.1 HNH endonuclease [Pseudomonas triclosanedens]